MEPHGKLQKKVAEAQSPKWMKSNWLDQKFSRQTGTIQTFEKLQLLLYNANLSLNTCELWTINLRYTPNKCVNIKKIENDFLNNILKVKSFVKEQQ